MWWMSPLCDTRLKVTGETEDHDAELIEVTQKQDGIASFLKLFFNVKGKYNIINYLLIFASQRQLVKMPVAFISSNIMQARPLKAISLVSQAIYINI